MKQSTIILIGRINRGQLPIGGETAKNQNLSIAFSRFCKVIELDYYNNHKRPWIYLQTFWYLLFFTNASIVLSTSAKNIYPLLKFFKFLGIKRNIIHWIVGGDFDKLVESGKFDINILNVANIHLAQSHKMVSHLLQCGLKNVRYIPNVRHIPYVPNIEQSLEKREKENCVRFVFLSRIMESKGVTDILDCANLLNQQGLATKFVIDFYGRIDESYKDIFEKRLHESSNIHYKGVLDLRSQSGYDTLSTYHVMLFPTHHPSEGIAGVLVDAMIAGVPVFASEWGHNREIIEDGVSGIIIPVNNIDALHDIMAKTIDGSIKLRELSINAQKCVEHFDASKVITKELLHELNIL